MTLQRRLVICFILLSVCVCEAPAQKRPAQTRRGALTTARPKWTIQSDGFAEDGASTINVRLEPVPLNPPTATMKKARVQLSADFTSLSGREPGAPPFVTLTLHAHTPNCKAAIWSGLSSPADATAPALTVNLDGRPLPLLSQNREPRGEGVWWYSQESEMGCEESIGAVIKPQTLVKIVAARTISFQAGKYVFTLTGDSLSALRDFAGRLPPAK